MIIQKSSLNLVKTCKKLINLWKSRPSLRLDWLLLYHSNIRSVMDLIFQSNDIELIKLCIPKVSNEYKAHLAIDLCRSRKSLDEIILLVIDGPIFTKNLSLYIRALTFQENDYNDSLVYALNYIKRFDLPECILLFSVILNRHVIVRRILSDHSLKDSIEIFFIIGVYHNSIESIKNIILENSWICKRESFSRAIAICDSRELIELKTELLRNHT